MTSRTAPARSIVIMLAATLCFSTPSPAAAGQSAAAVAAFNQYAAATELRLAQQHRSPTQFLAPAPMDRLCSGQLVFERLSPNGGLILPGALLHDWRGTGFVAGATAADFERLLKDFGDYPTRFAPQVLRARVIASHGDQIQATMRVSQRHIITVVMDTTYDIAFGHLDPQHGYSRSRSTAISEIESPGTRSEHPMTAAQEHGFLWRLDTYWTYEEDDGGLFIQIESVSLTRSIPTGLGWVVRPFLESVPRDSLDFTMRSVCNALHK